MDGPRLHEMLTPGSGPPRPTTGTTRAGRAQKASGTRPAIVSSLDPGRGSRGFAPLRLQPDSMMI
jgi:hypothetical protein